MPRFRNRVYSNKTFALDESVPPRKHTDGTKIFEGGAKYTEYTVVK